MPARSWLPAESSSSTKKRAPRPVAPWLACDVLRRSEKAILGGDYVVAPDVVSWEVRRDGEAVWTTTDGRVLGLRLERGQSRARQIADLGGVQLTAPALGADDTVYVGASDGRLIALPLEAARWQAGTRASAPASAITELLPRASAWRT